MKHELCDAFIGSLVYLNIILEPCEKDKVVSIEEFNNVKVARHVGSLYCCCCCCFLAQSRWILNFVCSVLGYIIGRLLTLLWSNNSHLSLSLLDILFNWLLYDNILRNFSLDIKLPPCTSRSYSSPSSPPAPSPSQTLWYRNAKLMIHKSTTPAP